MYVDRASVLTRISALYVDKLANQVFAPFNLSLAQYKILAYLFYQPEKTVTTAELEDHFQMSHSTSVGLLNNLERAGWIKRIKGGGRSKVIEATDKALTEKGKLEAAGRELENTFTENLSAEEVREYIRLSSKLLGIEEYISGNTLKSIPDNGNCFSEDQA